MEKWAKLTKYKDFIFDGKYEVSNYGEVRNIETKKPLAHFSNNKGQGYLKTKIYDTQKIRRPMYIHTLVALYFVEGYKDGLEVNHIDRNVKNNYYKNLEWVTHQENMKFKRGRV